MGNQKKVKGHLEKKLSEVYTEFDNNPEIFLHKNQKLYPPTYALPTINDLKPGDHICWLYQSEEDHHALIIPFIYHGLENSERVMYIHDTVTDKNVLKYLEDDDHKLEPYLESGQLVILKSDNTYISEDVFNPEKMIDFLRTETEKALSENYSSLRISGAMSWITRQHLNTELLIEYESKLNKFFAESKCLVVCQYNVKYFNSGILLKVLRSHPVVILGTEIYDNFYYVPPDELLEQKSSEVELRRCIENLIKHKQAEEVLRQHAQIIDQANDAVVTTDLDGNITGWNRGAEILFEYAKDEVLGKNISFFYKEKQRDKFFQKNVIEPLKEKGNHNIEVQVYKKSGDLIYAHLSLSMLRDSEDNLTGIVGYYIDVTEHKKIEEELKSSEERSRILFEFAPDGYYLSDLKGTFIDGNRAAEEISGYKRDELIGKNFLKLKLLSKDQIPKAAAALAKNVLGKPTGPDEFIFNRKDGRQVVLEIRTYPVKFENQTMVLGIARDITNRKKTEEHIKADLREKEVLLREVHHRVKNNLQVISSLLNLQSRNIKRKNVQKMFLESRNRIRSMSLIHEKLYNSRNLAEVDFAGYIKSLSHELNLAYRVDPKKVELVINVENVPLRVDLAVPCGLIINELVSNALKYAFPPTWKGKGKIRISFHLRNENEIELIVSDNGVGLPVNMDFRKIQSLGMHLVTLLAEEQLQGKIKLDTNEGTAFKIRFKV